jgi:hypothetical protein
MAAPTTDIAAPPSGGETVAIYDRYEDAERAVDYLSDHGFPVENAQIVGSDLHLVEQVTGRVTTGRAALAGGFTPHRGAVVSGDPDATPTSC